MKNYQMDVPPLNRYLFIYSFFLFSNPFSLITSPELVQFLGACICPLTE